jgi:CheY-like chemotaxis protein
MRILIADDDPTARELARHLIARAGHEVDVVADGPAALRAILSRRYALAVLDVQMPVLDGCEVALAARAALPAGACPRLVAFTAGADAGSERGLAGVGFDACLPKPVGAASLAAVLRGDSPPPVAPPPLAARPFPAPSASLRGCAAAVALLSATAALGVLEARARSLKGDAVAAGLPLLAGLCARLEAAAADGDRPAAAELSAAIVALLGRQGML